MTADTGGTFGEEYAHSNGDTTEPRTMPLAIVGMACRFGGHVTSPERLWELVSAGKDVWSGIPETRFNSQAFYHPDPAKVAAIHAKGGYFLEQDVGAFDVSFFNMSADAAAAMDPQTRLQLEVTFEALESAGIPLSKIAGSNTSVFTGSLGQDYKDVAARDPLQVPRLHTLGTDYSMMANRISHFFDLRGHSTSINTACSTSLMGLHLASQSLRSGDSDAVIVGGASLFLSPSLFSDISTTGLCGPDGRCYAFDHRAQGYGRGEGVGAVIVKRLSDAVRDGDPIRAVIRETGANQNGRTASITAPDTAAQSRLIEQCYRLAGLDPLETVLVEAHGTGTTVGDPREALAIGQTLGQGRMSCANPNPLYMASVKTNVGHAEAASGLAAIIKIAMSLEHGAIAPNLNFETVNPAIDLDSLGLKIPTRALAWPDNSAVRRASINNFGFGGTNTHAILEESGPLLRAFHAKHPPVARSEQLSRLLFVLSARDKAAAAQMAVRLGEHLEEHAGRFADAKAFQDLAYTLGERRTRFPWTVTVSAADVSDLAASLGGASTRPVPNTGTPPRLGFVFNGQGAQWFGMGRELMRAYPIYAEALRECDRVIASFGADWSVTEELGRDEASSRVNDVRFSMPLSCAVQLALVELLRDFGVQPSAVTGHSSGEVAAAFAAGALSLREAMACTYFRGLINAEHIAATRDDAACQGGMMAVGLGPSDVAPYLGDTRSGKVVIACINSPSSVTVSGDQAGVDELRARLDKEGVFCRPLRVQAAFHSHHMLPLQDRYLAALQEHMGTHAKTGPASRAFLEGVRFVSPVTGAVVHDPCRLGPQHWVENMIQPVQFAQALRNTVLGSDDRQQVDVIVEIGPHGALAGPIRQTLKSEPLLKILDVAYGSCLERGKDAVQTIQVLAGFLVERGCPASTSRLNFPHGTQGLQVATSLPSYPWNHSQRFWCESKMSIDHMQRKHAPHDLLGVRSPGTSDKTPIWRHMIRTTELPWLQDHVVQGNIVYPASGFIAMAIEAMRQIRRPEDGPFGGYRLSDVDVLKAVVVPENSEAVEVQLFLEPVDENSLRGDQRRFRIYSPSRTGEGWDEVVRGFVAIEMGESPPLPWSADADSTTEFPDTSMSPRDHYASLDKLGVSHGPSFRKVTDIRTGTDCSSFKIDVGDLAELMPHGFQQPYVIHPITLDQIFQGANGTLSDKTRRIVGAAVPRSIKSLYVSARSATVPASISVVSRLLGYSHEGYSVTSAVFDGEGAGDSPQGPVVQVDEMRYQSIGDTGHDHGGDDDEPGSSTWDICAFVDYEPSFSLNAPPELIAPLQGSDDAEEAAMNQDLDRATFHLVADAVGELTGEDVAGLDRHHRKLYAWMQQHLRRAAADELAPRSSRWARASPGVRAMLLDRVAGSGPEGEMLVRVGRRLVGILRREVAPLELMLEGDLLYRVYSETRQFRRSAEKLGELAAAFARERPRARILEIGAGTGGGTEPVLQALGRGGFDRYDFTDISSGFFPRARERFAPWGDKVSYSVLNIEDDVAAQGFAENSYDLVIAVEVLHATRNMEKTMRNVRRLLKDQGRLVLFESVKEWAALHLIFGVLPDWWLGEELERATGPMLSRPSWHRVLQSTGFSGVDMDLGYPHELEPRGLSLMVSTAAQQHAPRYNDGVTLVYEAGRGGDGSDTPPRPWLQGVADMIAAATGSVPTLGELGAADCEGKVCIFIQGRSSGEAPAGAAISFAATKRLLTRSKGALWVTSGATMDCPAPAHAQGLGVLRSYRAEDAVHRFVSLDLDPERQPWDKLSQETVARVFSASFDMSNMHQAEEVEFAERKGTIFVPRVHRDEAESATFANEDNEPSRQAFTSSGPRGGRQLRMHVAAPGRLDSIVFRDDEEAGEPLSPGSVEVAPAAYGLGLRHPTGGPPSRFDDDEAQRIVSECAGIVSRVGPSVTHIKEGDRVVALTHGGHVSSRVRVPATSMVRIPDHMSFQAAASTSLAFATAFYSLFEAARLGPGESVLVHDGTSSVGQACISLAQWKGLGVFATVRTPEQRSFLGGQFGIPDDRVFSCADGSFAPSVLAATNQRGVDAVINSLTGPLLQTSCGVLAAYGRFVDLGQRDVRANKSLDMSMFRRGASFMAVDLAQLAEDRGHVLLRVLAEVVAIVGSKAVRQLEPVTAYPMGRIGEALQAMQAQDGVGRHTIVPEADDTVMALQSRVPTTLNGDATYVIIGGLGGLGRSLARWLVDHGAKNLLLLSRNAVSSPYAQPLRDDLGRADVNLVFKNCNVGSLGDLQRVLSECGQAMPPVRGVINSAAVFNDSILESMTPEQWETSLAPKVAGTWNIHQIFSTAGSLDFLIILSSCVGMSGNASQTNYTAGGAFQDAVARHRAARGLPCVTVDLGLVTDLGYLADADMHQLAEKLETSDQFRVIREADLHRLIEYGVRAPLRTVRTSQVLTGLSGTAVRKQNGHWARELRFAALAADDDRRRQQRGAGAERDEGEASVTANLAQALAGAQDAGEAAALVEKAVVGKVSDMFARPVEEIDPTQPLAQYGVDSLVAVELRNWLVFTTRCDLSIFDLLGAKSLRDLAGTIGKRHKEARSS